MELTYKVRGGDGKEYGPATLTQITAWLREGRINTQTEMTRSDISHWAPAGNFSEVQSVQAPPPLPGTPVAQSGGQTSPSIAADPATVKTLHSGASWFYWIAALSLINSISALSGSDWRFIFGLGITQIFDALGNEIAGGGKAIIFVLDLFAAGILVFFGFFAYKRHTWAFLVGMILLALDSLIFLLAQDWIGVAFHAFVLFRLFRGFQACRKLNAVG